MGLINLQRNAVYLTVILFSMLAGFLLYIFPGFFLCLFLTIFLFYFALENTDIDDRNFVLTAIWIALFLRILSLMAAQYYCYTKGVFDIFGDAANNFELGFAVRRALESGEVVGASMAERLGYYNIHGKTYFNGIFFTVFGNDIFSLKYIDIICVLMSGWFIYDLTRKIYSPYAAKIAMSLVLYWPTIFIWSITDLKESHVILAMVAMLWSFNKIFEKNNINNFLALFMALIISGNYVILLRYSLFSRLLPLTLIIASAFIILKWLLEKNCNMLASLILIVIIFIFLNGREHIYGIMHESYGNMISQHKGFIDTGGWCYDLLGKGNQNYNTATFFIRYFVGAWYHFLFEPLPHHLFSLSMVAVYPMMIGWYAIVFFSFLGVIKAVRIGKIKDIFPSLIFTILYISVVGMSTANIGTTVRLRDTITPIVIMFASCGIARIFPSICFKLSIR